MNATQTFTVFGRIATTPAILGSELSNDQLLINFAGIPGETYSVQATVTLNPPDWQLVATRVASANGLFQYVDSQVKVFPMRFFRAINP